MKMETTYSYALSPVIDTKPNTEPSLLSNYEYEVLREVNNPVVQNFCVFLNIKKYNLEQLDQFIEIFREEKAWKNSNISIYTSKGVKPLLDNQALSDEDYIYLADRFIAMSSFDTSHLWEFPFRDTRYYESGGINRNSLQELFAAEG